MILVIFPKSETAMLTIANLMLSAIDLLKRTGSWLTIASLLLVMMSMATTTMMRIMMLMIKMMAKIALVKMVRRGRIKIFNALLPQLMNMMIISTERWIT